MSIHDELSAELKDAMRSGDRPRINVIRQVETEVTMAKTAPGFSGDVDDDLYTKVITSYVKKMDKARREYEELGDRGRDNADKLAYEVGYLARWLPTMLSDDETRVLVRTTISEMGVNDPKQAGRVIGAIMKAGSDVDGAVVNRIVREELGA